MLNLVKTSTTDGSFGVCQRNGSKKDFFQLVPSQVQKKFVFKKVMIVFFLVFVKLLVKTQGMTSELSQLRSEVKTLLSSLGQGRWGLRPWTEDIHNSAKEKMEHLQDICNWNFHGNFGFW